LTTDGSSTAAYVPGSSGFVLAEATAFAAAVLAAPSKSRSPILVATDCPHPEPFASDVRNVCVMVASVARWKPNTPSELAIALDHALTSTYPAPTSPAAFAVAIALPTPSTSASPPCSAVPASNACGIDA